MDTNALQSVLSQLKAAAAQANGPSTKATKPSDAFSNALTQAINSVNQEQAKAEHLVNADATGAKVPDISQVMVAVEKANLSFQAMVEVRNKLVSAYQEIMNLQV